jgi:membrane protease YdiL (CAAX protease family)
MRSPALRLRPTVTSRGDGPAFFWAFVTFFAVSLAVSETLHRAGVEQLTAATLGYGIGAGLAIAIARRGTRGHSWKRLRLSIGVNVARRPKSEVALAVAGLALLTAAVVGVGLVAVGLTTATLGGASFGTKLVLVGIVLPIIEELMFRGILQGAIGTLFGPRETILIVAAVFCFSHAWSPVESCQILASGLMLSVLRARGRSLMGPVTFHVANNVLAVLVG